jgi:outer membrane receptor protein involved in Fe transport
MPLNQGDGEAYLQDLDLRSVKYAELYRGADALRYGSLTLGGAINLITMTGRDAPPLETWLTGGSFGLLEAGMLSGWSNGPFDVFLNASSHFLDGFRDHSQENSQKVFSSLGYRISEWAENRLYLFWGRLSQNNPSSLTQEVMLAKSFSILTGFQAVYVQRNYVDGNQSNNEDFRGFSPKLGFLYQWNNQCKAYLNVSGSFQPPSFDQSLETAPDGNQLFNRLDAQTALTVELGTAGKAGPFSWDLAVYRSWVRNERLDQWSRRSAWYCQCSQNFAPGN